jgi:predicted nucleic acid-binding protein
MKETSRFADEGLGCAAKVRYIHCFDASALVKLVSDDEDEDFGREALRAYYREHSVGRCATSYCVRQAFSAFKRNLLLRQLPVDDYIQNVLSFLQRVIRCNLQIEEVPIIGAVVYRKARRFIKKHKIDPVESV